MATVAKIDVHAHYFPPAYEAMLARHGIDLLDGAPKPAWSEDGQLETMDKLGIEAAVLSLSSPSVHQGDAGEAVETARACNEHGARLSRRYPGRFAVAASLPLPELEASIEEIRYCRNALGIESFALLTHARGVYLGDPALNPVMAELGDRPTTVVVHPSRPSAVPPQACEGFPAAFMEYFFDTTRAVANMMANGTLRAYPNIRFVIPHAGAFLPVLSDRLAVLSAALGKGSELDVAGDLARLYYDLAGVAMPKQYALLGQVTTGDHLLYGSDSPFTPMPLCERFVGEMGETFDCATASKVFYENALTAFPELSVHGKRMTTDLERRTL